MNNEKKPYTLITGASHGIGKALAEACARRGMNVALVALPGPELRSVAEELKQRYAVDARCLGVDLTQEGATLQVWEWCQQGNVMVNMLINNAGFGRSGLYERGSLLEYQSMVKLNNMAMVELIHYFMDHLKEQPKAWIMNTSSLEATLPLPYKTTYTSTKAFIYAFSLAIREELRESNVSLSVLCPGGTETNEDAAKRVQSMGPGARLLVSSPEFVAERALKNLLKGKAVIIPGAINVAIVRVMGVMPTLVKMRLLGWIFKAYKGE